MGVSLPNRLGRRVIFFAFLLSLGQAGCGSSNGTVSGKVYFKDAPLKGGTITFVGPDNVTFLSEIKEDGSYSVSKVPPGEVSITVETNSLKPPNQMVLRNKPPADAPSNYKPPDYEARAKRFVQIPLQYSDPKQSGLKYTVKTGKQEHDIKLEG